MIKDENEIKLKRAYWEGVYYALDPETRSRSEKSETMWLTSEVWLNALDWVLGRTTDSSATIRQISDELGGWDG